MAKKTSAATDLIAAAVLTSNLGRRKKAMSPQGSEVDCTDCPFSLPAFALAVSAAGKKRKR